MKDKLITIFYCSNKIYDIIIMWPKQIVVLTENINEKSLNANKAPTKLANVSIS